MSNTFFNIGDFSTPGGALDIKGHKIRQRLAQNDNKDLYEFNVIVLNKPLPFSDNGITTVGFKFKGRVVDYKEFDASHPTSIHRTLPKPCRIDSVDMASATTARALAARIHAHTTFIAGAGAAVGQIPNVGDEVRVTLKPGWWLINASHAIFSSLQVQAQHSRSGLDMDCFTQAVYESKGGVGSLSSTFDDGAMSMEEVVQHTREAAARISTPTRTPLVSPDSQPPTGIVYIGDSQMVGALGSVLMDRIGTGKRAARSGKNAQYFVSGDGRAQALDALQNGSPGGGPPTKIVISLNGNGTAGNTELIQLIEEVAPNAVVYWTGAPPLTRATHLAADHWLGKRFVDGLKPEFLALNERRNQYNKQTHALLVLNRPNMTFFNPFDYFSGEWPDGDTPGTYIFQSPPGGHTTVNTSYDGIHLDPTTAAKYVDILLEDGDIVAGAAAAAVAIAP